MVLYPLLTSEALPAEERFGRLNPPLTPNCHVCAKTDCEQSKMKNKNTVSDNLLSKQLVLGF